MEELDTLIALKSFCGFCLSVFIILDLVHFLVP